MKNLTEVKLRLTARKYTELVKKMLDNNEKYGMYFDYIIKLDHKGGYMALYEIDIAKIAMKNNGVVSLGE